VAAHRAAGAVVSGIDRTFLVDAFETLLLVAYFAVVPVVVAVGLYFPLWYSLRQSARSSLVRRPGGDDSPATDGGWESPLAVWGVFVAGAAVVFGLMALFYWLVPNPFGGARSPLVGGVAFYSVFVSVIALPHVVVGAWWDRERGIWYVP